MNEKLSQRDLNCRSKWEALGHECRKDYVRCTECKSPLSTTRQMSPEFALWLDCCEKCKKLKRMAKKKAFLEQSNFGERMRYKEDVELLKKEGAELFSTVKTSWGKAQVLMHYICKADYWSARLDIERRKNHTKFLKMIRGDKYYPHYELDIDHYTEHWLHSMRDNKDLFDKETYDLLCKDWYTPKPCKYLPDGCAIYQFEEK